MGVIVKNRSCSVYSIFKGWFIYKPIFIDLLHFKSISNGILNKIAKTKIGYHATLQKIN